MNAEIICVGTELLLGDILNTNAQFLSKQLADLGIGVLHQHVVGDNPARLEELVCQAMGRSELLVFSGGLGPTADDLTKETVARCFGDTLAFEPLVMESITGFFTRTGRTIPKNNEKQAMVPQQGGWFENPWGTAPAVWFQTESCRAYLLPGPPGELKPLWKAAVLPLLEQEQTQVLKSLSLRITGIGESHAEELVGHLFQNENPTAAIYAKLGDLRIRITAAAPTGAEAEKMCRAYSQEFYTLLGDCIYAEGEDGLEEAVVKALAAKQLTLATAESCTGGLVAQRITNVPGSSEVFGFGFVTYANGAKQKLLGVRADILAQYGAVSSQVAAQMASGAKQNSGASLALALTGIAGPGGGTDEKPVGLVYLAAAMGDKVYVQRLTLDDRGRDTVRWLASQRALDTARRLINGLPLPEAACFAAGEEAVL